jgi:outer membrane receptor protein involved in Fe transport
VQPERNHYALHASVRSALSPRLTADIGLRLENGSVGPRLGARYELASNTVARANAGRIYQSQGIDELQVSDGVATFFPPQRADYISVGLEHTFVNNMELRAEVYDKRLSHLRPRYENLVNTLTLVPELHPDRVLLAPTRGRARGLEILLSYRDADPWSWWVGYTWSSAKEHLEGADVFRSWDQRHAVSAGINWSRNDWVASAALIHRSGWPTTAVYLKDDGDVPVLGVGARNSSRTSAYRSADVRVERKFTLDRSTVSVFLEVANVLGRDNVCCSSYEIDDEDGGLELERRNYVPRIPSLGFLWQF